MVSLHDMKCYACYQVRPSRPGPDGPKTLCNDCGQKYFDRSLSVYLTHGGKLTARRSTRAQPVKIIRFVGNDPLRPITQVLPREPEAGCCAACSLTSCPTWRMGPDGHYSLCKNCAEKYGRYQLPLYQLEDGRISAREEAGGQKVKHVSFLLTSYGRRDFLRPVVGQLAVRSSARNAGIPPPSNTDGLVITCRSCLDEKSYLRTGPDGAKSLCSTCQSAYLEERLQLYQGPDGTVSVTCKEGMTPVRHVGFKERGNGRRDLFTPIVHPWIMNAGASCPTEANAIRVEHREARVHWLVRKCLHCSEVTTVGGLPGPDGPETLCAQCGDKYADCQLLLYQKDDGSISIVAEVGSKLVSHIGFMTNENGLDDFLKPSVKEIEEKDRDGGAEENVNGDGSEKGGEMDAEGGRDRTGGAQVRREGQSGIEEQAPKGQAEKNELARIEQGRKEEQETKEQEQEEELAITEEAEKEEQEMKDKIAKIGQFLKEGQTRIEKGNMEVAAKREETKLAELARREEQARIEEQARVEEARLVELTRREKQARMEEAKKEEGRIAEAARRKEQARMEEAKKEQARITEVARREEQARIKEKSRIQEQARIEKEKNEEARMEKLARRKEQARREEEAKIEEPMRVEEARREEGRKDEDGVAIMARREDDALREKQEMIEEEARRVIVVGQDGQQRSGGVGGVYEGRIIKERNGAGASASANKNEDNGENFVMLVKVVYGKGEERVTRRFTLHKRLSYLEMMGFLKNLFVTEEDVGLVYRDAEDDMVAVGSDVEIRDLYREHDENGLRPVRMVLG